MLFSKPIYIEAFGASMLGKVRKNNEDNFFVDGKFPSDERISDTANDILIDGGSSPAQGSRVYAVFDGMGGEQEGEKASSIAVKVFSEMYKNSGVPEMLEKANEEIYRYTYDNMLRRCGTTAAVVAINDSVASVYNVGDSRVYLARKGKIKQLSVDHTQVQLLVDAHLMTKKEAESSPARHSLTQHLGMDKEEQVMTVYSAKPFKLSAGDRILICSDGVNEMISDDRLASLLSADADAKDIAASILKKAFDEGGVDNTTAIVIKAFV